MSLQQMSMRVDSRLIRELDRIAEAEFKRRSDIVREALILFVQREREIRQLKERATQHFLDGKLAFEDFTKIVGFEVAQQIKIGAETLKESIERARRDSKSST